MADTVYYLDAYSGIRVGDLITMRQGGIWRLLEIRRCYKLKPYPGSSVIDPNSYCAATAGLSQDRFNLAKEDNPIFYAEQVFNSNWGRTKRRVRKSCNQRYCALVNQIRIEQLMRWQNWEIARLNRRITLAKAKIAGMDQLASFIAGNPISTDVITATTIEDVKDKNYYGRSKLLV